MSDLQRIEVLKGLLLTLNDPRASAVNIARHVRDFEVLAARVEERYAQRTGHAPPPLSEQIAILGNRELEQILFEVLEDVVTLHSALQEGGGSQAP